MSTQNNNNSGTKRLTVGRRWFRRGTPPIATYGYYYVRFPFLGISGKWLEECGFCIGMFVDVRYETGKLTITLSDDNYGWVGDDIL